MTSGKVTRGIVSAFVVSAFVVGGAGAPPPAEAAWPGANGTIYFVCRPTGVGFAGQDICRVNPDGSGLQNLTNTPAQGENVPDVSPNGSKVSFLRTDGADTRVWVMNPDGSGQQQVTTVPSDGAGFTPDGTGIAYRAQVGGSYEFQVIPVAGGGPAPLRAAFPSDFPPRYTANGSWLYASLAPVLPGSGTMTTQVFVVDGTGVPRQVTASDPGLTSNAFPSWAPGGDRIVYSRMSLAQSDLYAVPAAGGAEVRLTNTPLPVKENWAQYSPDGTRLVFHQEDATHDFFHLHLMVSNADGSSPVPIATPGLDYAAFPVWAPTAVSPPPPPVASFTATAPAKVKGTKKVKVTLHCLGDTVCVVTYGAKIKAPGGGKLKIADKTVALPARTDQVVSLKLAKAAKRAIKAALAAGRKPGYSVSVVARLPGGDLIRALKLKVGVKS